MNNKKAGIIGTTVGIMTTLGTATAGVCATLYGASQIAKSCQPAADFLKTLVAGNFTIPAFNATIPFQSINIPVMVPSLSFPVSHFLGNAITDTIKQAPDLIVKTCYDEAIQHGATYTAIATSLFALLTYAYYKNNALRTELMAQHKKPDEENAIEMKQLLPRRSYGSDSNT